MSIRHITEGGGVLPPRQRPREETHQTDNPEYQDKIILHRATTSDPAARRFHSSSMNSQARERVGR